MRYLSSNVKATTATYLRRQMSDEYVKLAKEHSYRARSAFKLIEMDDRYHFLKPGKVVVDVGAAPGSWSQVSASRLRLPQEKASYLLSIDLQERKINVLLSDMAPNPTGDSNTDHLRLLNLCRLLLNMTKPPNSIFPLDDGAVFICKIWNGVETKDFIKEMKATFKKVTLFKPTACRESSAEMYVIGVK
ncbi:unnamed protein product, partial [Mesorhabditis belari]|uniref:rRNA methyltransferase 2, mitochondrial n=1 Tax=Mesorhabditis belari TaxID=2138241 RepID=A0AAF3EAH2_9BILA